MSDKFSCYVVGETSLLQQCSEILLQRGHTIDGIISTSSANKKWATSNGIETFELNDALSNILNAKPYDYLFSIANLSMLPDAVINSPRKGAVNYHDGPLPRYAGLNATAWAILNQEKGHGITWHFMGGRADIGDILKQRYVDISKEDTTFTLNAKCYEAGIAAFAELIDELEQGRMQSLKQNFADRSYFSKYKRPPAACTISWDKPADEIAAFIRALDFGTSATFSNPLGLPKFVIGNEIFIVDELEVHATDSQVDPGTIVAIEEDFIQVATGNNDVLLNKVQTVDGHTVSIADFVSRAGLVEGCNLDGLDKKSVGQLTALNSKICRHEEFWLKRVAKFETVEFPYVQYNKSTSHSSQYETVFVKVSQKVNDYLQAHCDLVSKNEVLITSFASYLARIINNYTFDLGFSHTDLKKQVNGFEHFFASYVPLRIKFDPSLDFSSAVDALKKQVALVKNNKTYATDMFLRYPELRAQGSHRGGQLPFNIIVEQVASFDHYTPKPGSELTLLISEGESHVQLVYNSTILDKERIASMQGQYATFLDNLTAESNKPVSEISLLTETEKQLMIEWNKTKVDYPDQLCVHHIFEEQVEKTPDSVAVVCEDQTLTYRQLNTRANQLANYLRKSNVGPETLVGVYMGRSLDMVVGLFGILKAGGAYLPLDCDFPAERIAFMMEDAQVPIILTQKHLAEDLPEHTARVIHVDADWDLISAESNDNTECGVAAGNLSYVIYTSGSTGKPKGVMVEHGNVVNLFTGMDGCIQNDEGRTWLAVTSLSFDISVIEIFWTLARGFKVVIAQSSNGCQESSCGANTIPNLIKRHNVSHFQCTPSMASMLIMDKDAQEAFQQLQKFLIGGEVFPIKLAKQLQQVVSNDIINMYGPTETTVWSTTYKLPDEAGNVLIGRPIANTEIHILDKQLKHVPIGVSGELLIGGAGVVRGYLNRPELTAERFIRHPFSEDPKERLYRTGDLARYLPDGNIDFMGRMDHQVKISGHRIELGEIEAVLNDYETVHESVAIAREDMPGQKRLVAYVIPRKGVTPVISELLNYAKEKLPAYMVPVYVVVLESFPKTPNLKIDRKALPPLEMTRLEKDTVYTPTQTEIEEALAELWAEGLGVNKVGRNDNFFDLGGNSLLAASTIVSIEEVCRVKLPLMTIFHAPTVASLAAILEDAFQEQEGPGSSKLKVIQEEKLKRGEGSASSPRIDAEKTLASIWAKTLHLKEVGRDDHFMDLGGESVQAVAIFAEIESVFGVKLPLSTMLEAPTIKQLAALLDKDEWSPIWSPLVAIKPEGSRPPFFCVHAHRGNVLNYYDLAHYLGPDQPFYGLQSRGLDGENIEFRTFQDMANDYLNEIRTVQPHGPYRIGGWCMGGCIALELARLLKEEGETVEFLALIDSPHPGYFELVARANIFRRFIEGVIDRIDYELNLLRALRPKERIHHLWRKAKALIPPVLVKAEKLLDFSFKKIGVAISHSQSYQLYRLYDYHDKAFQTYDPQVYQGNVAIFRASRQPYRRTSDPKLGWEGILKGEVELQEISGNYISILVEPSVRLLANEMKKELGRLGRSDESSAHKSQTTKVIPLRQSLGKRKKRYLPNSTD